MFNGWVLDVGSENINCRVEEGRVVEKDVFFNVDKWVDYLIVGRMMG